MVVQIARSVRIFYAYAHKDESLRDKLAKHLKRLDGSHISTEWYDREILPGADWATVLHRNLNNADIILLLISADFIASDYCYGIEMKIALERHNKGHAHVIPIILRPVLWEDKPISKLQVLPTGGKPVTSWPSLPPNYDYDEAFVDVAKGVRKVINTFLNIWKGDDLYNLGHYEEALDAYQKAIDFKNQNPSLLEKTGTALFHLKRYEEALAAYNDAICLDTQNTEYHSNKGDALFNMERYEEAYIAYKDAIHLDSHRTRTWQNMGKALFNLTSYEDALAAFKEAIRLEPQNADLYKEVGDTLVSLKRLEDALTAYEDAVRIKPDYGDAFLSISGIFEYLAIQAYNRLKQRADEAHERARQLGTTK